MKAWLAKLRISAALDDRHRPAVRSERKANGSEELLKFEQELTALDRALKQTAPQPQAPPSLHHSIMRALRAAEPPAVKYSPPLGFLRWLPVPVVVTVALLVVWHATRGPAQLTARDAQSLTVATTTLETGGQLALAVPSAVVTPLTDELEKVNRDLNHAAEFIWASLP